MVRRAAAEAEMRHLEMLLVILICGIVAYAIGTSIASAVTELLAGVAAGLDSVTP